MPLIDSLTYLLLTAFNAGYCNKSGYERESGLLQTLFYYTLLCGLSGMGNDSVHVYITMLHWSLATLVISHIILFWTDYYCSWSEYKFAICIISVIFLNCNKNSLYLTVLLSHNFPTQSLRQLRHLWRHWRRFCAPCWQKSVSCAMSYLITLFPLCDPL